MSCKQQCWHTSLWHYRFRTTTPKKRSKYDEEELEQCICEDETCNAPINQLHDCLKQNNLTTYVYKVNKDKLQVGDVIHTQIIGVGHFTVYEGNETDLTGFTGYILTTRQIPGQDTVPFEIQKEIRGQCPPCALLASCIINPLCRSVLVKITEVGLRSVAWCAAHQKECSEKVKQAKDTAKSFINSGHRCHDSQCTLKSRLTPEEQRTAKKVAEHMKKARRR